MKFVRFDCGRTGLVINAGSLLVVDVVAGLKALKEVDIGSFDAITEVLDYRDGQDWRVG